jgi:dCTP deaminase
MIYSDKDLKKALKEGIFSFKEKIQEEQIEPASIDLKLNNVIKVFNFTQHKFIDIKKKEEVAHMMKKITIDDNDGFVLHPGKFVLASTKEYIKLSNKVVARV